MAEQHKWADFPGFSVLSHPKTGKWIALLIRQKDDGSGMTTYRCDIRCGLAALQEYKDKPYLSVPFRIRGPNWVGVTFGPETEPEIVCGLLDRAMELESSPGASLIVLDPDTDADTDDDVYQDTLLPKPASSTRGIPRTSIDENGARDVPEMLLKMLTMYDYSQYSRRDHDAWNFYHQAKFMEDYTDDQPWDFYVSSYYSTYRDFSVQQLRGYFSWRARVRSGEYPPIAASMAYMYIYELLCGIGASSPEDTLKKLTEFEKGFLGESPEVDDSAVDNYEEATMRYHILQWRYQFAIVNELPIDVIREHTPQGIQEEDHALVVLRSSDKYTDDEVFSALCHFAGTRLQSSGFVKKTGQDGKGLFARLWRFMTKDYSAHGISFLTECFGRRSARQWFPLSDAVYYAEPASSEANIKIQLNEVRSYERHSGYWKEKRCWHARDHLNIIRELVQEADRLFRLDRNVGRPLKQNSKAAWATSYVESFLKEDQKAELEARKKNIRIDFTELAQIRKDASVTRDSLLTEDERSDTEPLPLLGPIAGDQSGNSAPRVLDGGMDAAPIPGLDDLHRQILVHLLTGGPAEELIRNSHLMDTVVMDTINDALFDTVDDNVLEYDGNALSIVEDYREDILKALGGAVPV